MPSHRNDPTYCSPACRAAFDCAKCGRDKTWCICTRPQRHFPASGLSLAIQALEAELHFIMVTRFPYASVRPGFSLALSTANLHREMGRSVVAAIRVLRREAGLPPSVPVDRGRLIQRMAELRRIQVRIDAKPRTPTTEG